MIKSKAIPEPTTLYIKHSIVIDLDVLKIIHQKLVRANYNKIEYKFLIRKTEYLCNDIDELRSVFEQNGVSELNELDINCQDELSRIFSIKFGKNEMLFHSHCCSIYQSENTVESHNLADEIFMLLNEKNRYRFKSFASKILQCQMPAYAFLVVASTFIYHLPDKEQSYLRIIAWSLVMVFVAILIFAAKQKSKILIFEDSPNSFFNAISKNSIIRFFIKIILIPFVIGTLSSIVGTRICDFF